MIQNVLREIGGIAGYGVISVLLFFTVFLGALIYAFAQKKALCNHMSSLPLQDSEPHVKETHE